MPADYVELHAASAFSFLRGCSPPEDLVREAARLQLPALAVLDRDNLCSAPRLYAASREHGVLPLVGAEITLEDGSVLPLLVENRTGYQNLCQLISEAKLTPRAPHLTPRDLPPGVDPRDRKRPCFATWAELAAHAGGLIALTGDEEGPVLRAWQREGPSGAEAALQQLARVFDREHLYMELQRRHVRGEETALHMQAALAQTHRLPLLATGGVRHATRSGRDLADVFTCLRHHTTLDGAGRLLAANAERHLRSARSMGERFALFPEAVANTGRLVGRLDFTLRNLGYTFRIFPLAPARRWRAFCVSKPTPVRGSGFRT